jgi:hypothetical protein
MYNYTKTRSSPKNFRATRALLCCACLFIVLTLACTHDPLTEVYPAREIALPHLAGTTDPQEGHQLRVYTEVRREDQAATLHVGLETQAAKRQRAKHDRHYHNSVDNGVPQGGRGTTPRPTM